MLLFFGTIICLFGGFMQKCKKHFSVSFFSHFSKCFLLTISPEEAASANEKIKKGDIIGLDAVIDCNTSQIDDLIADLKNVTFEEAESKPAVTGNIIK